MVAGQVDPGQVRELSLLCGDDAVRGQKTGNGKRALAEAQYYDRIDGSANQVGFVAQQVEASGACASSRSSRTVAHDAGLPAHDGGAQPGPHLWDKCGFGARKGYASRAPSQLAAWKNAVLGACWDSKSYSSSASPSRQAWRKGVLSPKRLFSRFRISTGPERMRFWGRFGAKTGTVS